MTANAKELKMTKDQATKIASRKAIKTQVTQYVVYVPADNKYLVRNEEQCYRLGGSIQLSAYPNGTNTAF
jgi:hypothetical protein